MIGHQKGPASVWEKGEAGPRGCHCLSQQKVWGAPRNELILELHVDVNHKIAQNVQIKTSRPRERPASIAKG